MIAWTKAKMAVACIVAAALTTATVKVSLDRATVGGENARLKERVRQVSTASEQNERSSKKQIETMRMENRRLKERLGEVSKLRNMVARLQSDQQAANAQTPVLNLAKAPPKYREAAETLRELQYEQFVRLGQKAMALQPLTEDERASYAWHINFFKQLGLAIRTYASKHGNEFPASLDELLATDLLDAKMKEELQTGRYEYLRFANAENKPELPAAWWRGPDERGVRVLVLNDGSAQVIREPEAAAAPGTLALAKGEKQ